MPSPIALAIAQFEGWFQTAGTRAKRNNNPGNLTAAPSRYQQLGKDGPFVKFATEADGWAALENQIRLDAERGHTMETFLHKYAPPSENDTEGYLSFLERQLGVSRLVSLASLVEAVNPSPGLPGTTSQAEGQSQGKEPGNKA